MNAQRMPGPGDFWRSEPGFQGDPLGELIEKFRNDPEKVAEADEFNDGMQSGEHYSELERAMADLHEMEPDRLIGSDLLTRLYRLARVHGEARKARIERMARDAFGKRDDYDDLEDAA